MRQLLLVLVLTGSSAVVHAQQCDDTLWKHVYHPARLIVQTPACITVTGVIVDATNGKHKDGVRHEADGDTHGWLKLDPQFLYLLNKGNYSNENGNMVFEIVCEFHVTQKDAVKSCVGYHSPIVIPPVGSRVRMTGSYVVDSNHARWSEVHPVSSIEIINGKVQ